MGKHIAQTVFNRYDRIMIDASSLMNYEALDLFFTRNGNGIRNSGRGILIPGSVQMEIARHVPVLEADQYLYPFIEYLKELIHSGELVKIVEQFVKL